MPQIGLIKNIIYILKVLAVVVITIADSFLVIFHTSFRPKNYQFRKHYRNWGGRVLAICGVKLQVIGEENIKDDETYIFVANHSSWLDIPIVFRGIPSEIRIIYKKELEKVPLFGWQLKKSSFIGINRNDPRKSMASLEEALILIRQNINMIIFPEGTRSKDGTVKEFKRGAFMLASKSGKPIIPVTITNSFEASPYGHWVINPIEVKLIIHEPVYYKPDLSKPEEKQLMDNVRNTIIEGFAEN